MIAIPNWFDEDLAAQDGEKTGKAMAADAVSEWRGDDAVDAASLAEDAWNECLTLEPDEYRWRGEAFNVFVEAFVEAFTTHFNANVMEPVPCGRGHMTHNPRACSPCMLAESGATA